jgi:hypothetical protein
VTQQRTIATPVGIPPKVGIGGVRTVDARCGVEVLLENRAGELAVVTAKLSEAKVDLRAIGNVVERAIVTDARAGRSGAWSRRAGPLVGPKSRLAVLAPAQQRRRGSSPSA